MRAKGKNNRCYCNSNKMFISLNMNMLTLMLIMFDTFYIYGKNPRKKQNRSLQEFSS